MKTNNSGKTERRSRRDALRLFGAVGGAGLLSPLVGGCGGADGVASVVDAFQPPDAGSVGGGAGDAGVSAADVPSPLDVSGTADVSGTGDVSAAPDVSGTPDVGAVDAGTDIGSDGGGDAGPGPDAGVVEPDPLPENCDPTLADAKGPFYLEGAPNTSILAAANEPGTRIVIRGRVFGPGCATVLEGALVDVWQADDGGEYHMDTQTYRLRGQMLTDAEGRYALESVKPGNYGSPGALRPAHLHFTVSAPGHLPVTTQMYFAGDPWLSPNDSCGSCGSWDTTRIVDMQPEGEGQVLSGDFDLILAKA